MKLSRFLKKIRLYGCAMSLRNAVEKQLLRLKFIAYKNRVRQCRQINIKSVSGLRVLVVMNAGGIGNMIEATPLVQAIRMLRPKSHLTILTVPGGLFDKWCVPDKIITSVAELDGHSFDHTFAAYWELQNLPQWDISCNYGQIHFPEIRLQKWLLKPEREYLLDMVKAWGYKGAVPPLYVSVEEPKEPIPPNDLRICLVPGGKRESVWRNKRWPYYDKLTELLLARYDQAQICLIGTPSDNIPGESSSDDRLIDLRGRLSLRETAGVLKNAALAVGNDCGPMHIADAVQTLSIIIFGPTCQLKNGYQNKAFQLSYDIKCRPCQYDINLLKTCPEPQCMLKLSAELVMERIQTCLCFA
jgi:lipopolysaccharide heptosyltransferase III